MSFVTTSTTPPTSPPTPNGSFARPATSSANPSFQHAVQESDETAYSIDFDALLGAKGSDDELTEEVPVDVVRSDDVDGPSDFTQNMEAWMRGELPKEKPDDTTPKQAKYQDKAAGVDAMDHAVQPRPPVDSGAGAETYMSDTEADESESEEEEQHESAHAAMEDLKGYVVSEEGEAVENASRRASIDQQLDILSSMDDVDEEEYRSPSASPNPPPNQNDAQQAPAQVSRLSFLQPTVEDHEDTPSPRSARPSPHIARQKTPEVFVEDFGDASQKQDEVDRSPLSRIGSRMRKSPSPKRKMAPSDAESGDDRQDLISKINRLARQLEDRKTSLGSRIQSLEYQLESFRTDASMARENEQRRINDLQKQHGDNLKDIEGHWQGRIKSATERYRQDLEEQKAAFALVKSSFESRLSATEGALQSQLAQKEAELEAEKSRHAQEKEQTRVGHEARVAALEENVGALQKQLAEQEQTPAPMPTSYATTDTLVPSQRERELEQQVAQEKASSTARIAELEARLSTSQAQLEALRTESLAKDRADESHKHTSDLLAASKSQITDLESSLSLLQKQLALARDEITSLRRDADTARESARVLREELSESHHLVSDKSLRVETLSAALEEERSKGVAARVVERMLENVRAEMSDERKATAKRTAALEAQAKKAREEKEREVAGMRRRAEEAVRKAAGMLGAERSEKDELKKAMEVFKTEVDQLRGRIESKKDKLASQAEGAAKDEEMENVRRALREQSLAVKKAKELLRTKDEEMSVLREDHETVNRAMDERIQEMLRAKEDEWRAKYDALLKEKKAFGRALMQEWGREECGQATPQKYRYKFVQRA
ncbi:hypothetical protein IWX90DRAFT_426570 [Phyllosticta citrichinensis]|uniref:Uncharacterized protein n=1 Tax=Phyllosticta citrichinensis TaxID=1130410 RepID=A0ABR1XYM7_9PEZI